MTVNFIMQSSKAKRATKYIGLFAVLGLGIFLMGKLVMSEAGRTSTPIPLPSEVVADDWKIGNPSASVTIIEYADFQCPACAATSPLLARVMDEYGDQVQLVYRYFPLNSIHPNADIAARAAEAAGHQNKFWEMHNMLFANQNAWSSLSNPTDTLVTYATSLDLNIDQFKADLTSSEIRDRVNRDLKSAEQAGLTGTPSIFVNGQQLSPNPGSFDLWQDIVEAELAKVSQTPTPEPITE